MLAVSDTIQRPCVNKGKPFQGDTTFGGKHVVNTPVPYIDT